MTTATAEPTEQTTEQDTIDQARGQQLLNSFTGMTDEQQTELFRAVKRIEGNGDGQAVEPEPETETETKPTGTPEPMPLDKAHGELVDALYGARGDLRRSMERFGAARTILCEPDNTPMSWQDICAVNYTLDGFVQQMEALDEFITAVIGSPAGERHWRADARAADPFRRPAPDGQAESYTIPVDDQLGAKLLPTLPRSIQQEAMREYHDESPAAMLRYAVGRTLDEYSSSDDFNLDRWAKLLDALPDGWLERQVRAEIGDGRKAVA